MVLRQQSLGLSQQFGSLLAQRPVRDSLVVASARQGLLRCRRGWVPGMSGPGPLCGSVRQNPNRHFVDRLTRSELIGHISSGLLRSLDIFRQRLLAVVGLF